MIELSIKATLFVVLALIAEPLGAAYAGPPFATDDPEPTDYRHFEIYLYSQDSGAAQDRTLLGLEVNYGLLPDVQISAALPIGFNAPDRTDANVGFNDVEFGIKYRFVEEEGWRPQVSFYPSVELPLPGSNADDSATHEFLPLWAQKSFGSWTTFGGGGYRINPGRDGRNSWFAGWAVLERLGEHLQLGPELYRETAQTRGGDAVCGFNVGALYDLTQAFHLVGAAGRGFGSDASGTPSYYAALEWTT